MGAAVCRWRQAPPHGLGGIPRGCLAQARERAKAARDELRAGLDPIEARDSRKRELKTRQSLEKNFKDAAEAYIVAKAAEWKNAKHHQQWKSTLSTFAYPVLGRLSVRAIGLEDIVKVLEPIWSTKNETATRLRGRIEKILDWATVRKYRSGDNPARWKGNLDTLFPAPGKIQKVKHHKALPIADIHSFMEKLSDKEGNAARALEFTILTAARSGETRGAKWSEIDLEAKLWTIPSTRMKGGIEHRVPLSDKALEALGRAKHHANSEVIFAAPRGGELSDMALTAVMRRMKIDAVPHGFRSTFRDWVAECTTYPGEVAEQALAHTLKNKVEAAYRRGDSLAKRQQMMNDWAKFCSKRSSETTSSQSVAAAFREAVKDLAKPSLADEA